MCWVDYIEEDESFTVEVYDLYNVTSITIPELGLSNYRPNPPHSGYITKGDNNSGPDSWITTQDKIVGKVTFWIPLIGWLFIIPKSIAGYPLDAIISPSMIVWTLKFENIFFIFNFIS